MAVLKLTTQVNVHIVIIVGHVSFTSDKELLLCSFEVLVFIDHDILGAMYGWRKHHLSTALSFLISVPPIYPPLP